MSFVAHAAGKASGAICLIALLVTGCRTTQQLPPVDLSQTGWQVRQGQAVWKPNAQGPELSGELLWASHADGRFLLQFLKTPIAMVEAQGTAEAWQISFPPQQRSYSGSRGRAPFQRFGWLQVAEALQRRSLPGDWTFTQMEGGWRLANLRSKEWIEGFLRP